MKIESKKLISIILVTLLTLTPILVGGVYLYSYTLVNSCKTAISDYISNETSISKELNCPDLDWKSNPLQIRTVNENNTSKISLFEQQNKSNFDTISTALTSTIPNIENGKYQNEFKSATTYIKLIQLKKQILSEQSISLKSINDYKIKFGTFLSQSPTPDLKARADKLASLEEFDSLSKFKDYQDLSKDIITSLLQSRNNKSSINDSEYIDLKNKIKVFNSTEFLALSDGLSTDEVSNWNKTIYSTEADKRIYDLAFQRGYKWRKNAQPSELSGQSELDLLTLAKTNIDSLIEAASKDGIKIKLMSGHRDPEDQKQIFTTRLTTECKKLLLRNCSSDDIKSGKADKAIEIVLQTSSVPGTSKHHTGRTADLNEPGAGELLNFKNTKAYQWIKADNYFNAKRFGFVPSYPPEGLKMGPNPEEWEFIYVGIENISPLNNP
jgi:LAS superfamily LD-carboxypeptidase LdcB